MSFIKVSLLNPFYPFIPFLYSSVSSFLVPNKNQKRLKESIPLSSQATKVHVNSDLKSPRIWTNKSH